jgi:hypothetical protein
VYDSIWRERETEPKDDPEHIEFFDTHIMWFLSITHEDYVNNIRRELETDGDTSTATLQFQWRDGKNRPINGLRKEFTITIIDTLNTVNDCASAEV